MSYEEEIYKLWVKLVYKGGLTPREWRKFNHLKKIENGRNLERHRGV